MNSIAHQSLSHQQGILFFSNLKRNLEDVPTWRIVSLVRVILTALRKSYPDKHLNDMLVNAPEVFQLIVGDLGNDEKKFNHLDELVELVMLDDQQSGAQLLKSELETLRMVIIILRDIQHLFEPIGVNILTDSLERELQDAMMGEAA
jgi:hypothetical protein